MFLKRVVMSLFKYVERLRRMDSLISMMATGTPGEFAEKLEIRRSTLFLSLQEMREMGVNIKYSCFRQSYYYADNRRIKIKLENILPEKTDTEKKSKAENDYHRDINFCFRPCNGCFLSKTY